MMDDPALMFSATVGLALAIDGALTSVLPTLTSKVAESVLLLSVAPMDRECDEAVL